MTLDWYRLIIAIGMLLSGYYFFGMALRDWYQNESLLKNPVFLIISAVLLFYSTSFLYFVSMELLYKMDYELVRKLSEVNRIFSAMMYLTLGIAFYIPMIFNKRVAL